MFGFPHQEKRKRGYTLKDKSGERKDSGGGKHPIAPQMYPEVKLSKIKGVSHACGVTNPLILLARPARFERATYGFVVGTRAKTMSKEK